jgi:hypothetical protein
MTAGAYAAGRGIDAGSRFGPGVREAGGATRP